MSTDEQAQMVDDISSIIMRGRYGRRGVGRPSDNPIDLRDARRIVEYVMARDARVRRDAALHEKQRIAGEVRLWASINDDLGYTESAETLTRAANDIDRIPEETP